MTYVVPFINFFKFTMIERLEKFTIKRRLTEEQKQLFRMRCHTFVQAVDNYRKEENSFFQQRSWMNYEFVATQILLMDSSITETFDFVNRRRINNINNEKLFNHISIQCTIEEQVEYDEIIRLITPIRLPQELEQLIAEYSCSKYWKGIS